MKMTIRKSGAWLQAGKVLLQFDGGPYGVNLHLFVKKACREWGYSERDRIHSFGFGPLFLLAW